MFSLCRRADFFNKTLLIVPSAAVLLAIATIYFGEAAVRTQIESCLALAPALHCPCPCLALPCPFSFSLNEKSLFIVSIERRDSPGKARHDTGRACLALALACLALPWLALPPPPALPCPLSFSINELATHSLLTSYSLATNYLLNNY